MATSKTAAFICTIIWIFILCAIHFAIQVHNGKSSISYNSKTGLHISFTDESAKESSK